MQQKISIADGLSFAVAVALVALLWPVLLAVAAARGLRRLGGRYAK